ncbi:hypothetical protein OS31_01940 [Dickeya oryzae]
MVKMPCWCWLVRVVAKRRYWWRVLPGYCIGGEASPQQILLLAFGRQAAEEMNSRIRERLDTDDVRAMTFHALALHIIQQCSRKVPVISRLETDGVYRREFLSRHWQQQCDEKKDPGERMAAVADGRAGVDVAGRKLLAG